MEKFLKKCVIHALEYQAREPTLKLGAKLSCVVSAVADGVKRVRILYDSMNQNEIARTLDMSESVVREYIKFQTYLYSHDPFASPRTSH